MFQFNRDFQDDFLSARDLQFSRALHPGIKTFDQRLETYSDQIPPG